MARCDKTGLYTNFTHVPIIRFSGGQVQVKSHPELAEPAQKPNHNCFSIISHNKYNTQKLNLVEVKCAVTN